MQRRNAARLNIPDEETKSKQTHAEGSHREPSAPSSVHTWPLASSSARCSAAVVTPLPYHSLYSWKPAACPAAQRTPGMAPAPQDGRVVRQPRGGVMDGRDNLVSQSSLSFFSCSNRLPKGSERVGAFWRGAFHCSTAAGGTGLGCCPCLPAARLVPIPYPAPVPKPYPVDQEPASQELSRSLPLALITLLGSTNRRLGASLGLHRGWLSKFLSSALPTRSQELPLAIPHHLPGTASKKQDSPMQESRCSS